ncbi:hypothetical protein [Streptomyces chartreusis]
MVEGFDGSLEFWVSGGQVDDADAEDAEGCFDGVAQEVFASVDPDEAGAASEGAVVASSQDGGPDGKEDVLPAGGLCGDGQAADGVAGAVDEPGDPGFAAVAVDVDPDACFDVVGFPGLVAVSDVAGEVDVEFAAFLLAAA